LQNERGFKDCSTLNAALKRVEGITPRRYRQTMAGFLFRKIKTQDAKQVVAQLTGVSRSFAGDGRSSVFPSEYSNVYWPWINLPRVVFVVRLCYPPLPTVVQVGV
jgi:hypothetical protein